jgi:hypothetical protein
MLMQSRHTALVSALLVLYVTVRRLGGRLETSVVLKLRSAGWFQTFGNIFTVCNIINVYVLWTKCDLIYSRLAEW